MGILFKILLEISTEISLDMEPKEGAMGAQRESKGASGAQGEPERPRGEIPDSLTHGNKHGRATERNQPATMTRMQIGTFGWSYVYIYCPLYASTTAAAASS